MIKQYPLNPDVTENQNNPEVLRKEKSDLCLATCQKILKQAKVLTKMSDEKNKNLNAILFFLVFFDMPPKWYSIITHLDNFDFAFGYSKILNSTRFFKYLGLVKF